MLKTPYLWLLLLLLSCQEATDTSQATTALIEKDQAVPTDKNSKKPLLKVTQRTHAFSSPDKLDFFRLEVRGESYLEGTVYFTITTRNGQVIHKESFPTADLEAAMVYDMQKATATEKEREAYIVQRLDNFVESEDFVSPAIPGNSVPDTSFVSQASWEQIQSRKNAIGFKYLLGKENGHLLVYDPEKKKAVRYGSFGG